MTGYHETNFSMAYSSHISWQNADSPVPNEVYPSLAFDSLFENRGSLRYTSILDRVKERVPIWKREHGPDGPYWIGWIDARCSESEHDSEGHHHEKPAHRS